MQEVTSGAGEKRGLTGSKDGGVVLREKKHHTNQKSIRPVHEAAATMQHQVRVFVSDAWHTSQALCTLRLVYRALPRPVHVVLFLSVHQHLPAVDAGTAISTVGVGRLGRLRCGR